MKKSTRRIIKILWLAFAIPLALVLFIAFLPGILWGIVLLPSDYGPLVDGGNGMLGFYAYFFGPFALLGLITFFLFRYLKQADKRDMQADLLVEASAGVTLKEKKIINALSKNGDLTLEQLSSSTGISVDALTIEVRELLGRRIVQQNITPHGPTIRLTQEESR